MINEAWIKTKSQELDIPFSHILSAYVLETTVRILAELADAKDFWLEDSDRLVWMFIRNRSQRRSATIIPVAKPSRRSKSGSDKIYCRHMKKKDLA